MNEFTHYGHKPSQKDLNNCGACALLYAGKEGPNYAGWPLAFIQNGRSIPIKYHEALKKELNRKDNDLYINNLKNKLNDIGFKFQGV